MIAIVYFLAAGFCSVAGVSMTAGSSGQGTTGFFAGVLIGLALLFAAKFGKALA